MQLKQDALAFHLHGAARAVQGVLAGNALPQALAQVFAATKATPPARGAMQDIAYRTMRHLGRSRALVALLAAKPPAAPLEALLCCALTLLEQGEAGGYDGFTVVDQAVNAAAAVPAIAPAKGMVNAVLRRFLRERDALLARANATPEGVWNYPGWWIDAVQRAYPEPAAWQSVLHAGNAAPPLTLRVNRRLATPAAYLQQLEAAGIGARQIGPVAVRLDKPVPVARIPGFADGVVSVQDAAAQLAAPLLDVQDGMRVLDACAAPGGKTGHLLELADIDLLALDQDAERLRRVEDNLQRLKLRATLATGDAAYSAPVRNKGWWDGRGFDRILADVPCTASGIVRRHPDIRWLRRPEDMTKLATLSARILDNLWQRLHPNGKLLLVTCSIWPEESERQAAAFAARSGAERLDAPGQLLPAQASEDGDHDGLFYALFRKRAA